MESELLALLKDQSGSVSLLVAGLSFWARKELQARNGGDRMTKALEELVRVHGPINAGISNLLASARDNAEAHRELGKTGERVELKVDDVRVSLARHEGE